jgi:hypothetical protein
MRLAAPHLPLRLSPRALFARLAGAVVFALALLIPFRASAAIVPACEVDVETRAPATPLESSCNTAEGSDHVVDSVAAPMCGDQGVSAIAPPRLLPIADARIEARTSCSGVETGPSCGPNTGDPPAISSSATFERAMLDTALVVPPSPFLELADSVDPSGGPRAGFGATIYHPPR